MLRILHLISTNFVGGPEKQILRHAQDATSREREIWVGSFREGTRRAEILNHAEKVGLRTLELFSGRFNPLIVRELAQHLRRNEISLLCTHGFKANTVGWVASRVAGRPQVAFVRGWTGENWQVSLYERLDRFVLARVDWIVCVSRPLAEQVSKKRNGRRPPVVIPNAALFLSPDSTLPEDRGATRRKLGLSESEFLVCAIGRLSAEKGHRYLLEAVPDLASRIPSLRVLVVGEGRERKQLEEQKARLGIAGAVTFVGFVNDVRPWIQACNILVNPSLAEGMPNVLLEAMALGTPVVATRVGGVPDLVEDQASGLLVPPGDSQALVNALSDLFASPARAQNLARNARLRVGEYSPSRQCERLLDLYGKVLARA